MTNDRERSDQDTSTGSVRRTLPEDQHQPHHEYLDRHRQVIGEVGLRRPRKGPNGTHRADGPAAIHQDGTTEWRIEGELHRTDGPALVWAGGRKEWHLHGKAFSKKSDWLKRVKELQSE